MTDEPRLLGGRYQLGALLGRGGMAEVRHARDTRLNRDVAVKQLRIDLATDPTFQERFRREAQAAAGLNHPNIVAVYDTGDDIDPATGVRVPYIVMELVEGHTLREILRTGRKIQPSKALEFTQGVLEALNYSHRAGIVHRDIKPANVMLTPNGTVKVMDFGIARAVADTSATMTQTAAVIGTAQYLSPEQARGESVDSRSDIYSAGCLLYELLVGRPPFTGESPVSVAYQHVREAPVPPSQLDPMITPGMDTVVLKALAKDPNDRYQSAAAMRDDISLLLAGRDIATRVPVAVPPTAVAAAAMGNTQTVAMPARLANTETIEEEPSNRRRTGLLIFLISLLVVVLGVGAFALFNPFRQTYATVPDVMGKTQEEAIAAIEKEGLVPKPHTTTGPDNDSVGKVIDQNPKGGINVEQGVEVDFYINVGPLKNTIPTANQQQCDSFKQLLTGMGFSNVEIVNDPEEPLTAKKGEITRLDPEAGQDVPLDQAITIYCATGESPVPQLLTLTEVQAAARAKEAGFTLDTCTKEPSESAAPGQIIKQTPEYGEMWERTKKITCIVAEAIVPPEPDPTETEPPDDGGEGEG
ncbi:MAG: Stk1 family PASTA domain-containing Ser/Thr kinase [Propionibacteriaceae bacterium]|jgi:serine/threonine-protein kinase|nr:Stk1 family PASTA domain-containing Ser/Thr kinase [Propionibacteriaceae bacterium]